MSTTLKVVIGAGAGAALAAIAAYLLANATPTPIIIGDGSVFISHGKLAVNSNGKEIEAYKTGHKVKTITVTDLHNSAVPPIIVPVDGRKWTLTSSTGKITFELRDHTFGKGVAGKCPTTQWQGSGTLFLCADDQLSPSTLTFTDGQNCPITGSTGPTCQLTCPSVYCRLDLEY
jgi:hypothetical protein